MYRDTTLHSMHQWFPLAQRLAGSIKATPPFTHIKMPCQSELEPIKFYLKFIRLCVSFSSEAVLEQQEGCATFLVFPLLLLLDQLLVIYLTWHRSCYPHRVFSLPLHPRAINLPWFLYLWGRQCSLDLGNVEFRRWIGIAWRSRMISLLVVEV